jgi:uncharacterized membrane protein
MNWRAWIGWIVFALVVAVATHMAAMHIAPRLIMQVATNRMGAVNTIHHQSRVTAASRWVVRPSPDLLYSACPFDLTNGPLLVTAAVPANTYWAVSVFDADTNNIFTLNDRQIKGGFVQLLIVAPEAGQRGSRWRSLVNGPIFAAKSSTNHGLVLFRTLISTEKDFEKIDAVRRHANCQGLSNP